MILRPATRRIVGLVEEVTGRPVELVPDPQAKVVARITVATAKMPAHMLYFRPQQADLSFVVAYQCGFVIRCFTNPAERRFQLAGTSVGENTARAMIGAAAQGQSSGTAGALDAFAREVYTWAMTQLRSVPIGMRVEEWLRNEYSELQDLQRAFVESEQQMNARLLGLQIGGVGVPADLLAPNAAYAVYAAQAHDNQAFTLPYRAAGLLALGEELFQIWANSNRAATADWDLVDAWANRLGTRSWYEWIPL